MRLKDKVCIVTGGSKGIGAEVAKLFSKEGAKVIAADMEPLGYSDANVEYMKLNVTDRANCKSVFDAVVAKYKKIDVLINNAGITQDAMTTKMTDDQWDKVIAVNLTGIFNLTRHVGPLMTEAGSGSIVNISSVVGVFGNLGQANYAATKSAIFGLTKTWAKEFARKGAQVRVNALAPGYIMTDILKTVPQDLIDKFKGQTTLGRLGEPEEVAKAILFLASDESSYVTGTTLEVMGGMRL